MSLNGERFASTWKRRHTDMQLLEIVATHKRKGNFAANRLYGISHGWNNEL